MKASEKPQLYVKQGNRYVPYVEPPVQDNKLYRKIGGRYVPWAMELRADALTEGVWVITRTRRSIGVASGKYLSDVFDCEKCSNLESLTLAQKGNLRKLCDEALAEVDTEGLSVYETLFKRVGYIINKLME